MNEKKLPACGNAECRASSGICGSMTYGWGKLDSYGYWEHPCRVCAAAFDARVPEIKEQLLIDLTASMGKEWAENYIKNADWLNQPAWPFASAEERAVKQFIDNPNELHELT